MFTLESLAGHQFVIYDTPATDKRWRCEGSSNSDDRVYLELTAYRIVRKTAAGAWIDVHGESKFVLDGNGKRWAYESQEWALNSFIKRKQWQIRYALAAQCRAEAQLAFAETIRKERF